MADEAERTARRALADPNLPLALREKARALLVSAQALRITKAALDAGARKPGDPA
jgi:hypothetical protein